MLNALSEKWNSLLGKPTVRILIAKAEPKVIHGRLLSSKSRAISQLLKEHGCENAWVHYYSPNHARSFEFSKRVPTNLHQQIRNIFLT